MPTTRVVQALFTFHAGGWTPFLPSAGADCRTDRRSDGAAASPPVCDADSGRSSSRSAPRWTVRSKLLPLDADNLGITCARETPARSFATWDDDAEEGQALLARAPKEAREKFVLERSNQAAHAGRGEAYLHRRSYVHQDADPDTHGVAEGNATT
jgi:hypothetical protein